MISRLFLPTRSSFLLLLSSIFVYFGLFSYFSTYVSHLYFSRHLSHIKNFLNPCTYLMYLHVLTFRNFPFYPLNIYLCFVHISKQMAPISLCSIDWLVFTYPRRGVSCAVRTGAYVWRLILVFKWLTYWQVLAKVKDGFVTSEEDHINSLIPFTYFMYHQVLTFRNFPFSPRNIFMCFVQISKQVATISLYSVNWLVFITETGCFLRGTDWTLPMSINLSL